MIPRRKYRGFDRYNDSMWREARDTGHRPDPPQIMCGRAETDEDVATERRILVQRIQRRLGRELTRQEVKDAHSLIEAPPAPPVAPKVSLARVAVLDPHQDPNRPVGQTSRATSNRRTDVLENECGHGRITAAAFDIGRDIQYVFEQLQLGGASNWQGGSRVDTTVAKEAAIERKLDHAKRLKKYIPWMRDILGATDAEIVRQVLGENRRYGDVQIPHPHLLGRERGYSVAIIAHRFRYALETLAASKKEPPE